MIVLLALCAYVMGFLTAIPPGATQFEIARRSLGGYLVSSLMVVAGSYASDTMYGCLALFGLSQFIRKPDVLAVFWMCNACLLIILGFWVFINSKKKTETASIDKAAHREEGFEGRRAAFLTGFSLAVTNPMMIAWWLFGFHLLRTLGVVRADDVMHKIFFLFAGSLGIASYLVLLAFLIFRTEKFISPKKITRIMIAFSVVLFGLGIFSVVRGVTDFAK
jgi:threonine/homoserine/homoserine lactone efflux protein